MKRIRLFGLAALLALGGWVSPACSADMENAGREAANFEESWLTADKMHLYLGLGSLTAAVVAGMTAPETGPGNAGTNAKKTGHYYAAATAAALGGAAVASGLLLHWDDISLDDGITSPDMLHMLLGIAGASAYFYALSRAPKIVGGPSNGHASAGIAGAALMTTAIALEW